MAERRYDEDEIREILTRATELAAEPGDGSGPPVLTEESRSPSAHGLTLAELEDVGGEVGIPPARIAEAAAALDRSGSPPPARTHFGIPIRAAHTVTLSRMLTEAEWDRFVVRLRDTFQATGQVRTEGSLRTWSNGNLRVLLEPLAEGARLRFQSVYGTSKQLGEGAVALAGSGAFLAAFLGILMPLTDKPVPVAFISAMFLGMLGGGAAMWRIGKAKARRWLPTREEQFRRLGDEVRRLAAEEARPEPKALPGAGERPGAS